MSLKFSCFVDRRNFGEMFSSQGLASLNVRSSEKSANHLIGRKPRDGSLLAIWVRDDPKQTLALPDLLVCEDHTEADWSAWITTFGTRLRPFSALTRLLSFSNFEEALTIRDSPTLGVLNWPAAGIVLGEVLAASGLPDKALESLSASACASTLAFAMFRASAVYPGFDQWAGIAQAWEFAREVTRQKSRTIDNAAVARVCAAAAGALGAHDGSHVNSADPRLLMACREIFESPHRAPLSLVVFPGFSVAYEMMSGQREDRVVAVSGFLEQLAQSSSEVDTDLAALALGYLVSRVAPGTMQHASLLARAGQKYAIAHLWYGFCAAVAGVEKSGPTQSSQRPSFDLPASARRVLRDLTRPEAILGPPSCDVSALELGALARTGGDPLSGLVTNTQGTVTIELLPAVCTVVNVSTRTTGEVPSRTQRERELLGELGNQIDRLAISYRRLIGTDHGHGEQEQASLFPGNPRKR